MRRRIGQWIDNLHLLDNRTGPSVRNDQRQSVFMFRTHVDEVNVESIDLGYELRQGAQSRFNLPPVVLFRPIASERLSRRELNALRIVGDGFSFWPLCVIDAPAQFG